MQRRLARNLRASFIPGRRLCCVLALCLACGCEGSDSDGDSVAGAGASSGDGIDDYVDAYCALARECCGAQAQAMLSSCEVEFERQSDLVAAARAGTVTLHEPAFGQCVAALQASVASCEPARESPEACLDAFGGTVAAGGACSRGLECTRGEGPQVCLRASDPGGGAEASGVCVSLRRGQAGEPCLTDYDGSGSLTIGTPDVDPPRVYCDRRDGLYCPPFDGVCTPLPGAGAPCAFDCAEGLQCDEGSCQPVVAEGAACASRHQCDEGLFCPAGVCVTPTIADTGLCGG